jgi:hypothetical protein
LILVALGIFLRSMSRSQTNYTFEDTLSQIGLGYTFLFLLAFFSMRVQAIVLGLILIGYWAAFAAYRAPGSDSTSMRSECSRAGRTRPGSRPIGTRTATWPGRSTPGS